MPYDLSYLSNAELDDCVRVVRAQISELEATLGAIPSSRQRTIKVVRATFLTAGGILVGAVDALGFLFAAIGLWDCVETLLEDARTMNAQHSMIAEVNYLQAQLSAIESEVQRRITFGS